LTTLYFCQRLRVFAASHTGQCALLPSPASRLVWRAGRRPHRRRRFRVCARHDPAASAHQKIQGHSDLGRRRGPAHRHLLRSAAVVLHPEKIVEELRGQARFYQTIQSDQGYWNAALAGSEIGVPLMITGLGGIIWMLWNVSTRSASMSWIAFALLLLSAVVWPSFQPFRISYPWFLRSALRPPYSAIGSATTSNSDIAGLRPLHGSLLH
jgi:hypothetical protein